MSIREPSPEGQAPDSPADVRPLPARPSLEYERKQARKLLRQLRKADPGALARVQAKHRASIGKPPDEFQLSDAQVTIAREYGFTSWPRLVEYFEVLARHELSGQRGRDAREPIERQDHLWRQIIRQHAAGIPWTAAAISRFVPRFFGRSPADVFADEITTEDARLVAARMNRFPSWQAMLETVRPPRDRWRDESPMRKAFLAIKARDIQALRGLLASHPELQQVANPAEPWNSSIVYSVIHSELRERGTKGLELSEWLASTELDLKPALNWLLLGSFMRMKTQSVAWLLEHGADPEWLPPNGITVLEHALYRYWNGDAVDLIARRVKPREAFWIAAGLGDVGAVLRYFGSDGKLTEDARTKRPDFTAIGPLAGPPTFGDSDLDILWEGFLIAAWNSRFEVMDVLLNRGLPIDYSSWGQTVIGWAIFEGDVRLVEFLVTRGTKIDDSMRSSVEELFAQRPHDASRRRILELCGDRDPEVVLRDYEERRDKRVMQTAPSVEKAFEFARLDAQYLGLEEVSPENLFVGLMREDGPQVHPVLAAGADLLKLRSAIGDRFDTKGDPPANMTADEECRAILMSARREAEQRKNRYYTTVHMLYALMRQPPQSVLDFIREAGGDADRVLAETETIFKGMG